MTILSGQTISQRVKSRHAPVERRLDIRPFIPDSQKAFGMSYGVTAAGYDIRIGELGDTTKEGHGIEDEVLYIEPGAFKLCASLEWIHVPYDLQVIVHDKSTWARQGLALQNTVLEPGWFGHITLELSNHGRDVIRVKQGVPIAQLVFHKLDEPTAYPYRGKYQDQGAEPVEAIHEPS